MAGDYPPPPPDDELLAAQHALADEIRTYRDMTTEQLHARLGPLDAKQAWWKSKGVPTATDVVRMHGLSDELVRRRQAAQRKRRKR
jgi:hypothetical protein